jgi:hypothetical protein
MPTRICGGSCKKDLELNSDNFAKKGNGFQWTCKPCHRAYNKNHYSNNVKYYVAKAKISTAKAKQNNYTFVFDYLREHPCVDCGEKDLIVLEFDHVRGEKIMEVRMMIGHSLERIQTEIAKCEVRCANCHRRKTVKQLGWYSAFDLDLASPA